MRPCILVSGGMLGETLHRFAIENLPERNCSIEQRVQLRQAFTSRLRLSAMSKGRLFLQAISGAAPSSQFPAWFETRSVLAGIDRAAQVELGPSPGTRFY